MQAALSPDVERAVERARRAPRATRRARSRGASRDGEGRRAARRGRAAARARGRRCSPPTRATSSARARPATTAAFLDRLTLTPARIEAMARGLEEIAALPDPVGETIAAWRRPNGLEIAQVRVPIGVVCMIYESRPNVTADSAALCLKTGNAVLLKGGSEAQATSAAIADVDPRRGRGRGPAARRRCSSSSGGREVVRGLLRRDDRIDVVIARGGEALKRAIIEESRIPVIKHFEGICHLYVDAAADLDMAERICLNAKVQRPSVCNAIENLLVHEAVAPRVPAARSPRRCARTAASCAAARAAARDRARTSTPATDADWDTEYLDLILSVRVVPSLDDAIAFIARARHRARRGDRHRGLRAPPSASSPRSTPPRCSSTPRRASPTASSSASAPRSASARIACTRAARWACASSRPTSTRCAATGRSGADGVRGRGGIGLFGGTFNPIHLGHLRAAEEVREALGLDEIRFVPAAVPPHKEADGHRARGRSPAHGRAGDRRRAGLPRLGRRARARRPVLLDRHAPRAARRGRAGRPASSSSSAATPSPSSTPGRSPRPSSRSVTSS